MHTKFLGGIRNYLDANIKVSYKMLRYYSLLKYSIYKKTWINKYELIIKIIFILA